MVTTPNFAVAAKTLKGSVEIQKGELANISGGFDFVSKSLLQ